MDTPVKTSRAYDGSRRRAAAEQTRHAILASARALFTDSGYAATSVQAVADHAGVSMDTVYASVGRKPELMLAVHDMILAGGPAPLPAEQRDYVAAVRAAPTAHAKLRIYAEAMGRLLPQTVPIMVALREAASTDPDCAAQYALISERRATNMRTFAADLRGTGELREDLSDESVGDLIWSLNSPEWFTLVTSRGMAPSEYAALLADVLTRTLLTSA